MLSAKEIQWCTSKKFSELISSRCNWWDLHKAKQIKNLYSFHFSISMISYWWDINRCQNFNVCIGWMEFTETDFFFHLLLNVLPATNWTITGFQEMYYICPMTDRFSQIKGNEQHYLYDRDNNLQQTYRVKTRRHQYTHTHTRVCVFFF